MVKESTAKIVNTNYVSEDEAAHPVGTMLGTVGGIAAGVAGAVVAGAATGATAGTVVGPVGATVGAVIGGIVGGITGHTIAEQVNPVGEQTYWEQNFAGRDYVVKGSKYDTYKPAYTYGVNSYVKHAGRSFDEIEPTLSQDWNNVRGSSSLNWDQARPATRDAYDRLHTTMKNSSNS